MKLYFVICLVCLTVANSVSYKIHHEWKMFKSVHKKTYTDPAEEKIRMKVFKKNKLLIGKHNRLYETGASTYRMAVNEYSDMSHKEFIARNTLNHTACSRTVGTVRVFANNAPDSFEWISKGAVTGVKNQGRCGSCWAFSTTGSLEGQIFLKYGKLISFSEQNLVDCCKRNNGCNGGWMKTACEYIHSNGGIESEDSYPYIGTVGNCRYDHRKSAGVCTGYNSIRQGDEEQLKHAVATVGPISVAVDASKPSFQHYSSGIYYEPRCSSTDVTHAVLVVGYGTDKGHNYYLVKNQWGTSWGEHGYIRMSRNRNNNCAIASYAGYPTV